MGVAPGILAPRGLVLGGCAEDLTGSGKEGGGLSGSTECVGGGLVRSLLGDDATCAGRVGGILGETLGA